MRLSKDERDEREFGREVAVLVGELTNTSKDVEPKLNRAARKRADSVRYRTASQEALTVKICDIFDNVKSANVDDLGGFFILFLQEKREFVSEHYGALLTLVDTGADGFQHAVWEHTPVSRYRVAALAAETLNLIQTKLEQA